MANEHQVGSGHAGTVVREDSDAINIKPEVDGNLAMIEPAQAPLDTLLRLVGGTHKIFNPEYHVTEQHPIKHVTTVNTAVNATATTIIFDDASFVIPALVGKNVRTGEQFWINSTTGTVNTGTGSVANIIRGRGTTAAAAMVVGDTIVFTSPASQEGQDKLNSQTRTTGSHLNYAQMIEHDISLSEQQAMLGHFTGSERDRLNAQGILEFRKKRNRAYLLNEPAKITATGDSTVTTAYITGGLRYWATQFNNADVGPGINRQILNLALGQLIRHGGGVSGREVWGLTSQRVWSIVSELDSELRRSTRMDPQIGFEVTSIKFNGGVGNLAIDHNMEQFDDEIIWFDLNNIDVASFIPTRVKRNVQTPGAHREEWMMYDQGGLRVKLPLSTMRMYNIRYKA